jgi:hypothetical protein
VIDEERRLKDEWSGWGKQGIFLVGEGVKRAAYPKHQIPSPILTIETI